MPDILYIEDDKIVRENYSLFLTRAGFNIRAVEDAPSALQYFEQAQPDLVLLDIGLGDDPDAGFHLCTELRRRSKLVPIIFLTMLNSDFDKISGMRLGADDYITKDINMDYLIVRIKALLNRFKQLKSSDPQMQQILEKGDLFLNMDTLIARWKDKPLKLSLTQLWMIHDLVKSNGARTPEQLMHAANITVQVNTLVVHIKNIRNIFLAVDPDFASIKAERGTGYRWVT